ncbi:MAG TPA: orotidine-5'-phosphate decarboxylase [Acidobacteriaceae bacterium]|nr:orotidine-5'-phosphate decarboxylase [Acidobacteriaceae bacterium]
MTESRPEPARLTARERVIVALDFHGAKQALGLVDQLGGLVQWFKVGLELYLAEGNAIVDQLRSRGHSVFLDLKLHDIPNTVAGAVRSASRAGAQMLTLHAGGGPAMLSAAAEAAASLPHAPQLLAVTVLTSMDQSQLAAVGVSGSPADQVLHLARMGWQSGIRGFVSSAQEVAAMRHTFPEATLVIPGIRPAGAAVGDQKRVATPAAAIAAGATYLVIGRPITQAPDPAAATQAILAEIESGTATAR